MNLTEKEQEKHREKLEQAAQDLKEQYEVELMLVNNYDYNENGGIAQDHYQVTGLIESGAVNGLNIKVGGSISHDIRGDGDDDIYLLFLVDIEGEHVGNCQGIIGEYINGKWDLRWGSY